MCANVINSVLLNFLYKLSFHVFFQSLPGALVQHLWYINFRRDIIHFQRAARTYLLKRHKAATVIQSHFRRWKIQNQFKELKAAVKIQVWCSVWFILFIVIYYYCYC